MKTGQLVLLAAMTASMCAASGAKLHAAASSIAQNAAQAKAPAPPDSPAILKQYCVTCHSERRKTGGLSLEGLDPASAAGHGDVWEKVIRKMRVGMMPPAGGGGARRPTRRACAAL